MPRHVHLGQNNIYIYIRMVSASSSTTFSNGLLSKKILKVSIEQLILCITKKRYREQNKKARTMMILTSLQAPSAMTFYCLLLFPGQ
jgi:ATP-dependent phosphoenolpyruvate carboxykinase